MDIFWRVARQSLIVTGIMIILSTIFLDMSFSLGILAGALAGIINFRSIVKSVRSLIGNIQNEGLSKPTGKLIFLSIFRLTLLFIFLFILISKKLVNVFGVLAGFTVVFFMIIREGLREAKSF